MNLVIKKVYRKDNNQYWKYAGALENFLICPPANGLYPVVMQTKTGDIFLHVTTEDVVLHKFSMEDSDCLVIEYAEFLCNDQSKNLFTISDMMLVETKFYQTRLEDSQLADCLTWGKSGWVIIMALIRVYLKEAYDYNVTEIEIQKFVSKKYSSDKNVTLKQVLQPFIELIESQCSAAPK